jgi:hypothetical protein
MQSADQTRTHLRNMRQQGDGTPEPTEMQELPRWESFPREDRHRLVCTILQAARRQVKTSPASSQARR